MRPYSHSYLASLLSSSIYCALAYRPKDKFIKCLRNQDLLKSNSIPCLRWRLQQQGGKLVPKLIVLFCKSCSKYWTLDSIPCIYSCTGVYPGCETVNPFCQQTTKFHKCWYYGIKTTWFHISLHILTHSGIHLNLHSTTSFLAKCEKLCCTYEKYDQ